MLIECPDVRKFEDSFGDYFSLKRFKNTPHTRQTYPTHSSDTCQTCRTDTSNTRHTYPTHTSNTRQTHPTHAKKHINNNVFGFKFFVGKKYLPYKFCRNLYEKNTPNTSNIYLVHLWLKFLAIKPGGKPQRNDPVFFPGRFFFQRKISGTCGKFLNPLPSLFSPPTRKKQKNIHPRSLT